MDDRSIPLICGIFLGIMGTIAVFVLALEIEQSTCEKKHDVYSCVRVYVPAEKTP